MTSVKRKRRSDRNHVIYMIQNVITKKLYVGITVMTGRSAQRALDRRVQKHVQRAFAEDKAWAVCESFRKYEPENHEYWIHDVVRGKKAAHAMEVALIDELGPQLNTFKKGM
jgi:hypothetical protein